MVAPNEGSSFVEFSTKTRWAKTLAKGVYATRLDSLSLRVIRVPLDLDSLGAPAAEFRERLAGTAPAVLHGTDGRASNSLRESPRPWSGSQPRGDMRMPRVSWRMGLFLPWTYSMKRGKSGMDLPGVVRASREISGGHKVTLELIAERERVPAILLLPDTTAHGTRSPGAVLLHGFTSR